MKTAIRRWGNSYGIRLNKETLERSNLKEDDIVEIKIKDGLITLIPTKKRHKTLSERFKNYEDEYMPIEVNWDKTYGKENW